LLQVITENPQLIKDLQASAGITNQVQSDRLGLLGLQLRQAQGDIPFQDQLIEAHIQGFVDRGEPPPKDTIALRNAGPKQRAQFAAGAILQGLDAKSIAELAQGPKLSPLQQKVKAEGLDPNTPAGQARARELNQRAATDPSLKPTDQQILAKATEAQLASAGFANRVQASNSTMTTLESDPDFDPISIQAALLRSIPGGNIVLSEKQQLFQQAKEDFITAVLRKESGAVISEQEFAREDKKFFPQIGDKSGTLLQKAKSRERAFQNLDKQSKGVFRVQFDNPQIFDDGESLGSAEGFNEGNTATNPQTGQKIIVRNGQWEPQ